MGVNTLSLSHLMLLTSIQIYFFINYAWCNYTKFGKLFKIRKLMVNNVKLDLKPFTIIMIIINTCYIFTTKHINFDVQISVKLLLLTTIVIIISSISSYLPNNNLINIIILNVNTSVYILPIVNNFISLFFLLEIFGTFFLILLVNYINKKSKLSFLSLKNQILYIILNSYIVTTLYILGCALTLYSYGTLSFIELALMSINHTMCIILIALMVKLGLPGLHFLKIKIYDMLSKDILFIYTVLTTTMSFIVFFKMISTDIMLCFLQENYFLVLAIILITILQQQQQIINFWSFFAYSYVINISLIFFLFIV